MLTGGLMCLGFFLAFLLGLPVVAAFERRRLRRAEEAFLRGRRALADADFLLQAGAGPDEAPFFLAARLTMAELCGVPSEMIGPEDTVRSLLNLQWDCGFIDDFVFGLEGRTGVKLPLGYPPDRCAFGAYLRALRRSGRT